MAENLLDELLRFLERTPSVVTRISLVAHSLGGLIVRAMCGLDKFRPLQPRLYTLMTLNSPHVGLTYNQRTANWGIAILKWWKQSASLEQLTMRDALDPRETFLYKLSERDTFSLFRYVLLVSSHTDLFVPTHSALIETPKASLGNTSEAAAAYREMIANCNESLVRSRRHTTVVKYTALFSVGRAQQVTGRAVHIAVVDDDTFIERLLNVSAAKYFQ